WMHDRTTAEPRPLTPDAITDEMVKRAKLAAGRHGWFRRFDAPGDEWMHVIAAALIEPPARPEGAEDIARLLTEDLGDFRPPVEPDAIADLLASRGVRVFTEGEN